MAATGNQDEARTLHEAQINRALGSFLLFFALIVLGAIFWTETGIGKLTNLGAGAVIGGIGAAMLWRGLRAGRRRVGP